MKLVFEMVGGTGIIINQKTKHTEKERRRKWL
jgi:hypothetical protein